MMLARDFRAVGRNALKGHWGVSIIVTLVAMLLGATSNFAYSSSASFAADRGDQMQNMGYAFRIPSYFVWFFALWASIGFFIAVIRLLLGGAMSLGLSQYNIRLVQGVQQSPFTTLFGYFSVFGRALSLQLAMTFFVFLWSLLFVIPGIVASYRYAMAPYLMSQNPNLGAMEAIALSKQMMQGHKGRLFCLHLSFIGWAFLCVFTLGIGFLWLYPYIMASEAAFFLERSGQLPGQQDHYGQQVPYGQAQQPYAQQVPYGQQPPQDGQVPPQA